MEKTKEAKTPEKPISEKPSINKLSPTPNTSDTTSTKLWVSLLGIATGILLVILKNRMQI